MKAAADDYVFQTEKELNVAELRSLVLKSNVLKRGAEEKQSALCGISRKEKDAVKE